MKVLILNSVCGFGSTGNICVDLAKSFIADGYEVRIAYGRKRASADSRHISHRIGTHFDNYVAGLKVRLFDNDGFNSKQVTRKFLKWADKYNPDVLWIHNLHGYYINVELLFEWIKARPHMEVKWTLHDCWSFTGHCAHFTLANCEKWKDQCFECEQKKAYPKSMLRDNSEKNYLRKKEIFTGVKKMTIVTPSNWLSDLVKQSFLKDYETCTLRNSVNRNVFKPRNSDFREKFGLTEKRIVLGVSSNWSRSKGFFDFIRLSELLGREYVIVLVGLSKKQMKNLPSNVLPLGKCKTAIELAEIYSAADVFVNLTLEDNYPTVNLEAQACGTPVITYRTGGSAESVPQENVCEKGDLQGVVSLINKIVSD